MLKLIFLILLCSSKGIEKNFTNLFYYDKISLSINPQDLVEGQNNSKTSNEGQEEESFFYFQIEDKSYIPESFSKLQNAEYISEEDFFTLKEEMTLLLESIEELVGQNRKLIKQVYNDYFTSSFDKEKLQRCSKKTETSFYCIYKKQTER